MKIVIRVICIIICSPIIICMVFAWIPIFILTCASEGYDDAVILTNFMFFNKSPKWNRAEKL